MKLRGGHNILLEGIPSEAIEGLPETRELHLPLKSRRLTFSEILVEDGERVAAGQALALDSENYSVPLLSPRGGRVRLDAVENHITVEEVLPAPREADTSKENASSPALRPGSRGERRRKLVELGAWQFLYEAHSKRLPDPSGTPRAVIVSTVRLEPFAARGDVQLRDKLSDFCRGLEHLQSLLEYEPIYLVFPDVESAFASEVRETLRGYAWIKLVEIPLQYPFDDFAVLARALGLAEKREEPVWALRTEGIFAIDRALTFSLPCSSRIVSLGGPAVDTPVHLRAMPGYPIDSILDSRVSVGPVRVINEGVLTGRSLEKEQAGLDTECMGLTVLPEPSEREMFGFTRLGWNRRSYSKCFLSSLRSPFAETLTTQLRGERRACISCNFCEEVCPAGIMPHLIHKYLYQDALEEAERARVDLCVECGLCSFVCPSKIDLRKQFAEAKRTIQHELQEIQEEGGKAE